MLVPRTLADYAMPAINQLPDIVRKTNQMGTIPERLYMHASAAKNAMLILMRLSILV